MEHSIFPTPDALYAQALKRHVGDRAMRAGLLLESLEPSTDDSVDAAWREAIARRRPALDQGTVEAGTRADLLVVTDNPLANVTMLRQREALALV
jgi:hypothetical protein